jgi:hypothetical protein
VEIRLDGGRKVTVAGLADDRQETIVTALNEALEQVQARAREGDREEAA